MRLSLLSHLLAFVMATSLHAENVRIDVPGATLEGTLLVPATPKALAIFLPGSGPTDRDGNSPAGLASDSYKLLAEAMASQSIATIRSDKRGVGKSTGNGNDVTIGLYATDAASWIALAKARTGLGCVWLTGHSEGGLVALATAQDRSDICGLVLLAAPGRPVSQILLEQLRAAPSLEPLLPAAEDAIFSLVLGSPVPPDALPGPLAGIFAPAVQPFLMDLFAFDATEAATNLSLPALVVQGTADLQITVEDADRLVAALPQGKLAVIEGMTHTLKQAADDTRAANLATYSDPTLPLAPDLVDVVTDFILSGQ